MTDPAAKGQSIVPAETRAEIVRLYATERMTIAQVSKRVFWAYGTVRKVLLEEGVERRGRGIPRGVQHLTQEQVDQTVELYMQGMGLTLVGERLGITQTAVTNRLNKAGVSRSRSEGIRLARRVQFELHGEDALTVRQRALLHELTEALPAAVSTAALGTRIGKETKAAREALEQLEAFGLVRRRRCHHHLVEWRRTELAAKDVLQNTLRPELPTGNASIDLDVTPLRDWIFGLIAIERRALLYSTVGSLRDGTDTAKSTEPEAAVYQRLGVKTESDTRRIYRILHEARYVSFESADRILTHANGPRMEDLWPHLDVELEDAA